MDAWSVGVAIAMLVGCRASSPFDATPELTRGEIFDAGEAAVLRSIREAQGGLGGWLQALDADGGGLLFRHGWLVKLLIGLLAVT